MANSASTSPSMTSTSHTMTAFPPPTTSSSSTSKNTSNRSSSIPDLLTALKPENRHAFITPPSSLPDASLEFVKRTLDAFAERRGEEQAQRLKEQRKKRKRGEIGNHDEEVLKIRRVHTEGFEVEQVWEQARRVIDALRGDAERALEELREVQGESGDEETNEDGGVELVKFDGDGV